MGVVLDHNDPPPWVDALLSFLRRLPGVDVRLLTLSDGRPVVSKRPPWLTDRIYSVSRAKFDPFGDITVARTQTATIESVDAIRAAGCGLLIWLAAYPDPGVALEGLAEHGIFTVRLGERNHLIPFWDEVANSRVTSIVTVFWHETSFSNGRAVRKLETSTVPGLFFTLNAAEPLVRAIRVLAVLRLEIPATAAGSSRKSSAVFHRMRWKLPPLADYPTSLDSARFRCLRKMARSARVRWENQRKDARWFVAMRPNSGACITDPNRPDLTGFKDVPLPSGTAGMADPFLWEAEGRNYLLFEELAAGSSRGRLGCAEVFENGSCSRDEDRRFSSPTTSPNSCVVPLRGDLFLLPETAEANRVDLYRFSRFPKELELVSSPIEGVALVDTTPVFIDEHWYFFTTTMEPFMETLLFSATRLEGPWSLHPRNPVSTSVRSCRSAGQLFWRDGRLFRPTQDCSARYGYAIAVNEVHQAHAA